MSFAAMIISSYLITVISETIAALFWRVKKLRDLIIILLINTITNITVNVLGILVRIYLGPSVFSMFEIAAEVLVFLSEALLFKKLLSVCSHPFLFSLTLNLASFAVGVAFSMLVL